MIDPIIFPFPPSELFPNKRLHWAVKAKITKSYRFACFIIAKEKLHPAAIASIQLAVKSGRKIELNAVFYQPDRRRRDDDNIYSAFKAARDGLADALSIDDRNFKYKPELHDDIIKCGQVCITLRILLK